MMCSENDGRWMRRDVHNDASLAGIATGKSRTFDTGWIMERKERLDFTNGQNSGKMVTKEKPCCGITPRLTEKQEF